MIKTQEQLTKALKKLINDEKLRKKYANNLYKTVSEKFLWKETYKKVIGDINEKTN